MTKYYTKIACITMLSIFIGCGDSKDSSPVSNNTTKEELTKQQVIQFGEKEALEAFQNYPMFLQYQNAGLKQMLNKWNNMCANIEWESNKIEDSNNQYSNAFFYNRIL